MAVKFVNDPTAAVSQAELQKMLELFKEPAEYGFDLGMSAAELYNIFKDAEVAAGANLDLKQLMDAIAESKVPANGTEAIDKAESLAKLIKKLGDALSKV